MKIKLAKITDVETINLIREAITNDETNSHKLSAISEVEINHGNSQATFVAIIKEEIVGYISIHENNIFNKKNDAIVEIFVHPKFQRKGIGKELYWYSESFFKKSMLFDRFVLGVLNDNEDAIRLYKSLGFTEIKKYSIGQYMSKNLKN